MKSKKNNKRTTKMDEKDEIKITNADLDETCDNEESVEEQGEITVDELIGKLASMQKREQEAIAKANEMKDTAQRIQAEFDNYRRRTVEYNARMKGDVAGEVVTKFLPVMDVISQALSMITDENVKKGVSMIESELLKIFASYDVTEIEAVGKEFDPRVHEAIMQVPAENEEDRDTIKEVFQKGYKMGDKVIRVARVIINK